MNRRAGWLVLVGWASQYVYPLIQPTMANRRMLAKSITNSSAFLMMPLSSQALYMHLNQNADDDGYCEYFGIIRLCGANADDLKVLQAKQFVELFDDKVLVLKDWKENNLIKIDRYQPSKYLDVYSSGSQVDHKWNQLGSQVEPQDRLGKGSVGKVINNTGAEVASPSAKSAREKILEGMEPVTRECWLYFEDKFSEIVTTLEENRSALNKLLALEGEPARVKRLIDLAAKAWTEPYTMKEVKASSPKALFEKRSGLLAWGNGKFTQRQVQTYS